MNIKILDSWLRDFLKTKASPAEIAKDLSLTSVSIERIETYKDDYLYDIEVTTNRPDVASVVGLAREAAAVLPEFGVKAEFVPPVLDSSPLAQNDKVQIEIVNDPSIVNRICAVVMDVNVKESPEYIKDRLEAGGIRSLNNIIDVTNYVMRTIGHPSHVFDFDRLNTKKLTIRRSKKGEVITTLDKKTHTLPGGDIVAVNDKGEIVDLLGIMGLENSVVTHQTKRILFFLDNNDAIQMRKTSMSLGIRSEAVQMNEKGIDPNLAMDALLYGISLYEKIADGKVVSDSIDIYPKAPKEKIIHVSQEKIQRVIGVEIPLDRAQKILKSLGFTVAARNTLLEVIVPSFRSLDVELEEDVIEEIARVYGYHNLPSTLPPVTSSHITPLGSDSFYWEHRIKQAMKYWGYTENYTYSMVSENIYEGITDDAITLKNPLDEDHVYMRKTLVPSLLQVVAENKAYKTIRIFEIANVYNKKVKDLPTETRTMAVVLKNPHASFFEMKGLIEQLCQDLGIKKLYFKILQRGGLGADIFIGKDHIGEIEILDDTLINMEINFEALIAHATLAKTYTPLSKFPPIIEDLSFVVADTVSTGSIIDEIRKVSSLVTEVTLLDKYKDSRTFHIVYQNKEKNLTNEEVAQVRENIIRIISEKFDASLK